MKNILVLFIFATSILNAQKKAPKTVLVEGGTFRMGIDESSYYDEYPDHSVTLKSFYIAKYEVTIEEYTGFCRTAGFDLPQGEPAMPVTNVSWKEAIMFCNWLSRANRLDKCYRIKREEKNNNEIFSVTFDKTANGYRLPTEAEWEYAARGGINIKHYAFSGSNDASEVAWFSGTGKMLHNVGELKPNSLGIYDMTGNAQEWVFDVYMEKYYKISPKENPVCEEGAVERVSRGGNYDDYEASLRITKRYYNASDYKHKTIGFRVAKNE